MLRILKNQMFQVSQLLMNMLNQGLEKDHPGQVLSQTPEPVKFSKFFSIGRQHILPTSYVASCTVLCP